MDEEVSDILAAARELKRPLVDLRQLALTMDAMGAENEQIRTEMVEVSERAMRQVNDLMRLTRLTDGAYEMEPVAVRAVCDAAKGELRRLVDRESFGWVKTEYRNRTPLVTANRELLTAVVYNFLLNAVNAARDEVRLFTRDTREGVEIAVRDYGPALPIEVWRELKRGGCRKPRSIAMRPGASGLTLYVASKFSQYMRTEMRLIRHRDGTSFLLWLPRSRQGSLFG